MNARQVSWATVLVCLLALLSPASAFEWVGKVSLDAEGLKDEEVEKRLAAIQRLATYTDSVALVAPHLLGALNDEDDLVRAAAGRVLARLGVKKATPVVTGWLNAVNPALRIAATDILGELGQRESAKPLIRSLGDTESEVRLHAVFALGKIATDEAVVPLIARLGDTKADVRRAAIAELAKLADSRALIPLVGAMNDSSTDARLAAIRAVGKLGDPSAVPALMRLLRDPLEPIKVAAISALGSLEAAEATDRLIAALGSGSDGFRGRAAFALGQIAAGGKDVEATRRSVRALVGVLESPRLRQAAREALLAAKKAATTGLIDHLRGEIPGHPKTAVLILRDLEDPRATPILLAELERGRLSRILVLDALSKAGDERALVPVLTLLSESDSALRLAAMRALPPMLRPGSAAADVLLTLLDDREREIRLLAIRYLGIIKATVATKRMETLAKGAGDQRTRMAALKALTEIGDAKALPTMLGLLEHAPPTIRREAAHGIMELGAKESMKPLLSMLKRRASSRTLVIRTLAAVLRGHTDEKARGILIDIARKGRLAESVAAIVALGASGDRAAEKALIALASNKSIDRRRAAATALGDIGADSASKVLVGLLADEDDSVAAAAALAVGKLGITSAAGELEKALRRRGFATPVNAAAALVMLAPNAGVEKWKWFLHHPRRLVRANAVLAVARSKAVKQRGELEYLITRDQSWVVRRNAARALSMLGKAKAVLERVAKNDSREEVSDAAGALVTAAFVAPKRDQWRVFYVVDPTSDDRAVAQEPYFVIAADGIATAFYSDVLGQATEETFPAGPDIHGPMAAETEY